MEMARCIEYVESHRAESQDLLQHYAEIRPALEAATGGGETPRFSLMTLRYGERITEATVAWCDEILVELRDIRLTREEGESK